VKIAIEKIKVMARIRKEITKIDELASDIQQNGLLNAVTVMPLDGGEFRLLAGLRRIRAVQALGWTEIDVNVVSPIDAEKELCIEISENEQREPFTISERVAFGNLLAEIEAAKARERMLAGKSINHLDPVDCSPQGSRKSRDIIGAKIGMSGRQYDRAKFIAANAPEETIEQVDKGERSIADVYSELRAQASTEKPSAPDTPMPTEPDTKPGQQGCVIPKARIEKPMSSPTSSPTATTRIPSQKPLSAQDQEAARKISEYHALPPEGKIEHLQQQLRAERARAAEAESELARLKELYHNAVYHKDNTIENLSRQLTAAHERIQELEAKYEPV